MFKDAAHLPGWFSTAAGPAKRAGRGDREFCKRAAGGAGGGGLLRRPQALLQCHGVRGQSGGDGCPRMCDCGRAAGQSPADGGLPRQKFMVSQCRARRPKSRYGLGRSL